MAIEIFHQPAPTPRAADVARSSRDELDRVATPGRPSMAQSSDTRGKISIDVPLEAVPMMRTILAALADGQGLLIAPEQAELTTAQAAEILNVSRPFIIKLVENGSIPHRKVGTHRRICTHDVVAFKRASERYQRSALAELVTDAQAEDMGY